MALDSFKRFLDGRDITLLSKQDYSPFLEFMKNEYPNKVTRNIRLRSIRAFLYWLKELDYIEDVPFKIKQEKVNKKMPKYFNSHELKQILTSIDQNSILYSWIIANLNTGLRIGEIRNSYYKDGFLHVYEEKTDSQKEIAIDSFTFEHFKRCIEP